VTKELLDKKIDNEASEKQLIEKKFLNASDEMVLYVFLFT